MLTRLHAQGYKALRNVETTFAPLTVIVGPNGCGKTSVLDAIAMVRDLANTGADAVSQRLHPLEEIASRGGPARVRLELWLRSSPHEPSNELGFFVDFRPDKGQMGILGVDEHRGVAELPTILRMNLDVRTLASPSFLPEATPTMRVDGAGLATVLNWLQGERDERFGEIEQGLRRFVPEVRSIRTRRVKLRTLERAEVRVGEDDEGNPVYEKRSYPRDEIHQQVVIDYEHAEGVPAPHASEGTLLLLGLLTAIHTSDASVLLLDDIERGLHPKSQQQLVGYLREMTEQGIQIIATSHSPYLLLHLEYEQVRAMTLDGAHGSRIGKLSDHPQFEQWKEEMSPSEFWTVFGEDWLRGQTAE